MKVTKIKKLLASLMILMFLLSCSPVFAAFPMPQIYINNKKIKFNVAPVQKNGVTFVQFRPIFEALNLNITYDGKTQTVTGYNPLFRLKLTIGKKVAEVNGRYVTMQVAPIIINGNTMIPLRVVGEITGFNVNWDKNTNIISLNGRLPYFDEEFLDFAMFLEFLNKGLGNINKGIALLKDSKSSSDLSRVAIYFNDAIDYFGYAANRLPEKSPVQRNVYQMIECIEKTLDLCNVNGNLSYYEYFIIKDRIATALETMASYLPIVQSYITDKQHFYENYYFKDVIEILNNLK